MSIKAMLIHGMGNDSSWWNHIPVFLERLGFIVDSIDVPYISELDSNMWTQKVAERVDEAQPTIIIGHSLGAAVSLNVSKVKNVDNIILLGMPPFLENYTPPAPRTNKVPMSVVAKATRFLKNICLDLSLFKGRDVCHFLGENDKLAPYEFGKKLPCKSIVIEGVGHEFIESAIFTQKLIEYIVTSEFGVKWIDPAIRYLYSNSKSSDFVSVKGLSDKAPPPVRADIEITTRCQLDCAFCYRSSELRDDLKNVDMSVDLFKKILQEINMVKELIFVGLGEPLLHPLINQFVLEACKNGIKTTIVTNGVNASPQLLKELLENGLNEITFSIDTVDSLLFKELRGGADLKRVLKNFKNVPVALKRSIFTALSKKNVSGLSEVINFAAANNIDAIAVSDLNFQFNKDDKIDLSNKIQEVLEGSITLSKSKGVRIISPNFHNIGEASYTYKYCTVKKPADLMSFHNSHKNCLAPWRIAVVNARGDINPCNCTPYKNVGNISEGFQYKWNDEAIRKWRLALLNSSINECFGCPRY